MIETSRYAKHENKIMMRQNITFLVYKMSHWPSIGFCLWVLNFLTSITSGYHPNKMVIYVKVQEVKDNNVVIFLVSLAAGNLNFNLLIDIFCRASRILNYWKMFETWYFMIDRRCYEVSTKDAQKNLSSIIFGYHHN